MTSLRRPPRRAPRVRGDGRTSRRSKAAAPPASLRDTLLEAAATLIAKKGVQGFSLREVARRAHVSEAAPYWHFADREALLAAVAEHGFGEMARRMTAIRESIARPRDRLHALGVAYVRFALDHPSYLRVMFGAEVPDKAAHPGLAQAGARTFDLLVQTIGECQAAGDVRHGDPVELAVAAWSTVHGLAALLVDGRLADHARSPADAERLAVRVAHVLRTGLAPRPDAADAETTGRAPRDRGSKRRVDPRAE